MRIKNTYIAIVPEDLERVTGSLRDQPPSKFVTQGRLQGCFTLDASDLDPSVD